MTEYEAVFPKTDAQIIMERLEWLETFVKGQEEVIQCLVEAIHHINNSPGKLPAVRYKPGNVILNPEHKINLMVKKEDE